MKEVKTVQTIQDLIEMLSKLDPDGIPLIHDGEWGYLPITEITIGHVKFDEENQRYVGFCESWERPYNRYPLVMAVGFESD